MQEPDLADQIFSIRNFTRTLSYREFVTSFSLALLLLAMCELIVYCSNENWIDNNNLLLKWISFVTLVPINHVFYKIDHKRSNNFSGRSLQDSIFLLLFTALYKAHLFIFGFSVSFDTNGAGGVILLLLAFAVIIIFLELFVALIKRFFNLFKWQVL